jgi:hypothetical protein
MNVEKRLRHPKSEEFHQLLQEMGELHDRKQRDYGRADDPFANVRNSAAFGVPAWVGCMMRANDKMARIQGAAQQLANNGEINMANESLEDSLLDLAVYSLIGLILYREDADGS